MKSLLTKIFRIISLTWILIQLWQIKKYMLYFSGSFTVFQSHIQAGFIFLARNDNNTYSLFLALLTLCQSLTYSNFLSGNLFPNVLLPSSHKIETRGHCLLNYIINISWGKGWELIKNIFCGEHIMMIKIRSKEEK